MALIPIVPVSGEVITPSDELAAAARWAPTAKAAEDLQIDIGFWLQDTVYVGDPNSDSQFKDPRYNPPVALPIFQRQKSGWATTAEVAGHEAELISYFKRVQALLAGRSAETIYWLRLRLESAQAAADIGFPWYDTVPAMRGILDWLRGSDPAPLFSDLEQGWDVQGVRRDGRLYFREGNFDTGETNTTLWVDEAAFRPRFAAFEARALPMIQSLGRELDVPVWR